MWFKLHRDGGTPTGTCIGAENNNFLKFKNEFGCWNMPKYPNGNVSGTGKGNC